MTAASAYRALLLPLPRSFREEFADEMTEVFLDQLQRTSSASRAALWLTTIGSVLALSCRLRFDRTRMDVKHAMRALARQKTFTITAAATLALALGPATAVFSVVRSVILDPLPGSDVRQVVYVWATNPARNFNEFPWSELNFLDHRERQRGFSALAAYTGTRATFGGDTPQQLTGAWVSADIFDVLGVAPARGRRFEATDMLPGAARVVVLSDQLARARFGERDAVGQSLLIDGEPTTVIAVLPAGILFPAADGEFWQPLIIDRATSSRGSHYLSVIGKLEPDATPESVATNMNQVAVDLEREHPNTNTGFRVTTVPAAMQLTRSARRIVSVLALAALAIFLLAATNIASLMVVRTAARQPEIAVRAALGASGARLTRQLLTENLLLSALAAAVGTGVAWGLLRLLALTGLVPPYQIARSQLDLPVLLFLFGLMALTAVSLGWVVSRRVMRAATVGMGQRSQSAGREAVRLRQVLVGIEVGAAVVLLAAAALLLQSAARLVNEDPGFQTDNIIAFQIGLPSARYPDAAARTRFIDATVERLAKVPGVTAATSAGYPPMTPMRATRRFAVDGKPLPAAGTEPLAIDLPAGPEYAGVMGLRVIDGRWIEARDRADAPPVVVISESFAKQYFPGERAVGQRLRYYSGRPNTPPPPRPEIIGVVSDVRQFAMAEQASAQMYVPQAQRPWSFTSFFVKTAGDAQSVFASLPGAVRAIDPERPIEDLRTLGDLVDDSTQARRALSALLALAAGVALLIATIGVYGVTAATTAARRRELAIRTAIGADRAGLLRLVIRQGMIAAALGVATGLAAATAAATVLESVLYEIPARDPATLATVGTGLLLVCWVATYLPARRALTVNPAEALRAE
jgi:predicted permease